MGKAADEIWTWVKQQLGDKAALLMACAAFVGFGVAWGRSFVGDVDAVKRQVDEHERKIAHHEEDLHQVELDMREVYRIMPRTRDSDRLEHPWPGHDGGDP